MCHKPSDIHKLNHLVECVMVVTTDSIDQNYQEHQFVIIEHRKRKTEREESQRDNKKFGKRKCVFSHLYFTFTFLQTKRQINNSVVQLEQVMGLNNNFLRDHSYFIQFKMTQFLE